MLKRFTFVLFLSIVAISTLPMAHAATRASDYVSANTYNNLYPYMNNTMRTGLNPGTTPSQSGAQINVLARTKTSDNTTTRNVVPRRATTTTATARSATATNTSTARAANIGTTNARSAATGPTRGVTTRNVSSRNTTTARSGTTAGATNTARAASPSQSTRRVVTRSATGTATMTGTAASRTSRGDGVTSTVRQSSGVTYTSTGEAISSARCMADYTDCMNDYCERADTEYNRCYCSAQLAQINAQYKPAIDTLIKQILTLKSENYWTEEEMNEYWMDTIGKYTGDNSWENLDDALDIDWSSTESTVRGQQAFAIGHQYCVQHLTGCAYMQTNMRDAYRSEIARDCATYESSLQKLKNAAESIVEAYK